MTDSEIKELNRLEELEKKYKASKHLLDFTKYTFPKFDPAMFHEIYYQILDLFAKGIILNLIITMPPQHGKSTGSTMYLPAFLFGLNPDLKIAISSYSTPVTQRFNREVQRIIDDQHYREVFPDVFLGKSNVVTVTSNPLRNASEFEIVDSKGKIRGKLISVGRGGALTSHAVDIWIGDDLYKDYEEGNSPIVRDAVWNWYVTVPLARQPKQKLKTFTRWHEDDSIGLIEKHEDVVTVNSIQEIYDAINKYGEDVWIKVNFEAIKNSEPTELDNREKGLALWEDKRPLKNLTKIRALDPEQFNCLYQGNPQSKEGMQYSDFKIYKQLPEIRHMKNCTDTADKGTDFLCSINYGIPLDSMDEQLYVTGIMFTDEGAEITEPEVAKLLNKQSVRDSLFESNSGGEAYARNVQKLTSCNIDAQFQSGNKESRIVSNASTVNRRIVFPERWSIEWPEFYDHITRFKKMFKANRHDDGPDTLTMIVEAEERGDFVGIVW